MNIISSLLSNLNYPTIFILMLLESTVIPVPGGFGAYHSVVAGAISAVWGIPFATGMVFAILAHESQVIVQAVLGLGSYVYESFIRK